MPMAGTTCPSSRPACTPFAGELTGFKAVERQNVTVSLGQRLDLNFTMEVGGLTETVQVVGTSPVIDTQQHDRRRGDHAASS